VRCRIGTNNKEEVPERGKGHVPTSFANTEGTNPKMNQNIDKKRKEGSRMTPAGPTVGHPVARRKKI